MMSNSLSKYFQGIGAKRLSNVDVDPKKSNQHEIRSNKFREILGTETRRFSTKFIYITDEEEKNILDTGEVTWYDTRKGQFHRSPEYALYYTDNSVIEAAMTGDLVIIGKIDENSLAIIIAPRNSTTERQLLWLFGIEEVAERFLVKDLTEHKKDLGFSGRYIISSLGFEIEETASDFVEILLNKYGKKFPSTKEFSEFARSTVKDVSPIEEPDKTLIMWLEREELLFKTLEKEIVKEQLSKGFGEDGLDVDEFIRLSLSVHNRRKSRAGFSFENNLAVLFETNNVTFSHGAITERNNKPDFVFPSIEKYHDENFKAELLTMLGLKTTAKDRWRQVLAEASRISNKHLITLEPSISQNQTEEMRANNLQLVIPQPIHHTFNTQQQSQILNVKDFISLVQKKQA